jgi:hypothetical protein
MVRVRVRVRVKVEIRGKVTARAAVGLQCLDEMRQVATGKLVITHRACH